MALKGLVRFSIKMYIYCSETIIDGKKMGAGIKMQ